MIPHTDETPVQALEIEAPGARLRGDLSIPRGARGAVVFAHGSGSGRLSPRNRAVAGVLQRAGLATLLLDLLSRAEGAREEAGARLRFDVALLADRLLCAVRTLADVPAVRGLPVGLFGASTGAAAALIAAAREPRSVGAVVSRGGRPDLAGEALERVRAPTLLIVGGADHAVLDLNREALSRLGCERELVLVPGATHLFEEPGALEQVARLAAEWFVRNLAANGRAATRA